MLRDELRSVPISLLGERCGVRPTLEPRHGSAQSSCASGTREHDLMRTFRHPMFHPMVRDARACSTALRHKSSVITIRSRSGIITRSQKLSCFSRLSLTRSLRTRHPETPVTPNSTARFGHVLNIQCLIVLVRIRRKRVSNNSDISFLAVSGRAGGCSRRALRRPSRRTPCGGRTLPHRCFAAHR